MTSEELKKLSAVRYSLRRTGYFAFEKNGSFLLYHEVSTQPRRNLRVLISKDIDKFAREVDRIVSHG